MSGPRFTLSTTIIVTAGLCQSAWGITATDMVTGDLSPADLANVIVDAASAYSIVTCSANSTINSGGGISSDSRAMGIFSNGVTAAGTLLPAANQNASGNATYAGGIDIDSGICLCTGLLCDLEGDGVNPGFGVGVEGPNNGQPFTVSANIGETSFDLEKPGDDDFASVVTSGFDAAVLTFKITLTKPGRLRISFVHASDEFPAWTLSTFNDTPLAFVGDANGQNLKNFILFKGNGMEKTLSLNALNDCHLLKGNLVAPTPTELTTSPHANVGTTDHYNLEYGGFTKRLTRETKEVFAPATYTVKIVVQDASDQIVDSATFFEAGGLKLFDFLAADFDLDGDVDGADFLIWQRNQDYTVGGKTFTQGDANGDGFVTTTDLNIFSAHYGQTGGHADLRADFDRNGVVDGADFLIWQRNNGLATCASRFEGDADDDGDVDAGDLAVWQSYQGGGSMAQTQAGAGNGANSAGIDQTKLKSIDADHDGDFDRDDIELWKKTYSDSAAGEK